MIELIAECSTNHGGSVSLAKEFIDRFADAGATFIKFQYTRVKHLRPDDPQFAWFQQAELSDDAFAELKAHTESRGAKFLLTCFNHQDVPAIAALGCEAIKIGSGEQNEETLNQAAFGSGLRVIRSVYFKRPHLNTKYGDVLTCVTRYPASLRSCFTAIEDGIKVQYVRGYSDHAIGMEAATWAIELGARIIEKHVQLEHQARPPRPFEATVSEFKYLRQFADDDPDVKFRGRWQFA